MEANRIAISTLIHAGHSNKEITHQLGVHRNTVSRVRTRLGRGLGIHPPPRAPRTRTVRTPRVVKAVKKKIKKNPNKSMTKIGAEDKLWGTLSRRPGAGP